MDGMTTKKLLKNEKSHFVRFSFCVRTLRTVRFGHAWVIPVDAEKPQNGRSEKKHKNDAEGARA